MTVQGLRPRPWPSIDVEQPPPTWLLVACGMFATVVLLLDVMEARADTQPVPAVVWVIGVLLLLTVSSLRLPGAPLTSAVAAPVAGAALALLVAGAGVRVLGVLLVVPLVRMPQLPRSWRWQLVLRCADVAVLVVPVGVAWGVLRYLDTMSPSLSDVLVRLAILGVVCWFGWSSGRELVARLLAKLPGVGPPDEDPIGVGLLLCHIGAAALTCGVVLVVTFLPDARPAVLVATTAVMAVWTTAATLRSERREWQLQLERGQMEAVADHLRDLYAMVGRRRAMDADEQAERLHSDLLQRLVSARVMLESTGPAAGDGSQVFSEALASARAELDQLRVPAAQSMDLADALKGVGHAAGVQVVDVVVDDMLAHLRRRPAQRLAQVVRRCFAALDGDQPPQHAWVLILGPISTGMLWDGPVVEVIVATDTAVALDSDELDDLSAVVSAPAQTSLSNRVPDGGVGVIVEVPVDSIPDLVA